MAEEQKTNGSTKNKKSTTKKKTTKKAKTTRKKHTKHKKHDTTAKSEDTVSIGVDKALVAVLILTIIVGSYLLHQNMMLSEKIGQLTPDDGQTTSQETQTTQEGEQVEVRFYVMSQCPYGYQVMDAIAPVLKKIGSSIDFKADYIATETADGTFSSLRGQPEVDENIRQLCAMKHYPNNYQYMDYITCRNKNIMGAEWESCARQAGMDAEKIRACSQGPEGKNLHSESIKRSTAAGARGSPTMFIGGASYGGGRQEADFLRAICSQLKDQPTACGDLPKPVEFEVIVLGDERCSECDPTRIETQLKQVFPSITFKKIDYSTAEGKRLYSDSELQYLPAFLFTDAVTKDPNYGNVQRYLVEAGDYLSLLVGANFDPTKEICDNGIDDTGNGLIDCEDPDCKGTIVCREEIIQKLDLFVMSECPYGVMALDAMEEILDAFPSIAFGIHYIADYNEATGEFRSLKGQSEVDENIRQLCAIKYNPEDYQYMDYIWCRNKNLKGDWRQCATEAGLDADQIAECFESGEGADILKEDIKVAQSLKVSGSPTWLANNKHTFGGITAEAVKTNYCRYNPGLPGCEKTLSQGQGSVAVDASC
jgi:2-hydroxychromene-2-carboxylate isomerase